MPLAHESSESWTSWMCPLLTRVQGARKSVKGDGAGMYNSGQQSWEDGEEVQALEDDEQVKDLQDGKQTWGLKDGEQVEDLEGGEQVQGLGAGKQAHGPKDGEQVQDLRQAGAGSQRQGVGTGP